VTANVKYSAPTTSTAPPIFPSDSSSGNQTEACGGGANQNEPDIKEEPSEHLQLLANQISHTLRAMVLSRYKSGASSFAKIYQHFDRQKKTYFDAKDLMKALADLRIETTERVANLVLSQMILDSVGCVTFGEFRVFVFDMEHRTLELKFQEYLGQLLERQRRPFQHLLNSVFWGDEQASRGAVTGAETGAGARAASAGALPAQDSDYVTAAAFATGLRKLAPELSESEIDRFVARFDVYGKGQCSVSRFLTMARDNNPYWRHAELILFSQEEVSREAAALRQKIHSGEAHDPRINSTNLHSSGGENRNIAVNSRGNCNGNGNSSGSGNSNGSGNGNRTYISEDVINMAEYLGIRVLTEPQLLWIAEEALQAPLPPHWIVKKVKESKEDNKGNSRGGGRDGGRDGGRGGSGSGSGNGGGSSGNNGGEVSTFFFNQQTGQSQWEHPLDSHYRQLRDQHRGAGESSGYVSETSV
jgi:Ca2+-binding EF-hand superfamily protein